MPRSPFSQPAFPYRWLLFAGDLGGGSSVVTADVLSYEISMQYALYGNTVRLGCELTAVMQRKERYPGEHLWLSLLSSWERPGRPLPPDITALLELVRRHQAEYDDIRESEAVLRALGGT